MDQDWQSPSWSHTNELNTDGKAVTGSFEVQRLSSGHTAAKVSIDTHDGEMGDDVACLAHMVDNLDALKWAVKREAIGMEVDINFDLSSSMLEPTHVHHGSPSSCSFDVFGNEIQFAWDWKKHDEHICSSSDPHPGISNVTIVPMLKTIATDAPSIKLLWIDSKGIEDELSIAKFHRDKKAATKLEVIATKLEGGNTLTDEEENVSRDEDNRKRVRCGLRPRLRRDLDHVS